MADETLQQQPPTFSDELYKYAHDSGFIPKEATFDIFKKNLSNKDFVKELYDYSVQTEFIPKEATIDIFIKNIGGTNPAEKKNEKPATVSPVGGGSSGLPKTDPYSSAFAGRQQTAIGAMATEQPKPYTTSQVAVELKKKVELNPALKGVAKIYKDYNAANKNLLNAQMDLTAGLQGEKDVIQTDVLGKPVAIQGSITEQKIKGLKENVDLAKANKQAAKENLIKVSPAFKDKNIDIVAELQKDNIDVEETVIPQAVEKIKFVEDISDLEDNLKANGQTLDDWSKYVDTEAPKEFLDDKQRALFDVIKTGDEAKIKTATDVYYKDIDDQISQIDKDITALSVGKFNTVVDVPQRVADLRKEKQDLLSKKQGFLQPAAALKQVSEIDPSFGLVDEMFAKISPMQRVKMTLDNLYAKRVKQKSKLDAMLNSPQTVLKNALPFQNEIKDLQADITKTDQAIRTLAPVAFLNQKPDMEQSNWTRLGRGVWNTMLGEGSGVTFPKKEDIADTTTSLMATSQTLDNISIAGKKALKETVPTLTDKAIDMAAYMTAIGVTYAPVGGIVKAYRLPGLARMAFGNIGKYSPLMGRIAPGLARMTVRAATDELTGRALGGNAQQDLTFFSGFGAQGATELLNNSPFGKLVTKAISSLGIKEVPKFVNILANINSAGTGSLIEEGVEEGIVLYQNSDSFADFKKQLKQFVDSPSDLFLFVASSYALGGFTSGLSPNVSKKFYAAADKAYNDLPPNEKAAFDNVVKDVNQGQEDAVMEVVLKTVDKIPNKVVDGLVTDLNTAVEKLGKTEVGENGYEVKIGDTVYQGNTAQDLQNDIDDAQSLLAIYKGEQDNRKQNGITIEETETPPIAEADQTDVELAKPEAGVGVEGEYTPKGIEEVKTEEIIPERVQNAQESGQNDTNVTFEGKRGQADSISFDGKTIKQGEEIELNDVNISQDDSMPDLRSGKYKVRMLSVDANGKTATLTLTDGNEVITTTVKDLRKALPTPTTTTQTAPQEGVTEPTKAPVIKAQVVGTTAGLNTIIDGGLGKQQDPRFTGEVQQGKSIFKVNPNNNESSFLDISLPSSDSSGRSGGVQIRFELPNGVDANTVFEAVKKEAAKLGRLDANDPDFKSKVQGLVDKGIAEIQGLATGGAKQAAQVKETVSDTQVSEPTKLEEGDIATPEEYDELEKYIKEEERKAGSEYPSLSYKEEFIHKNIGRVDAQQLIDGVGEKVFKDGKMALRFTKKGGQPIDDAAMELSSMAGVKITRQDIFDYFVDRTVKGNRYVKQKAKNYKAAESIWKAKQSLIDSGFQYAANSVENVDELLNPDFIESLRGFPLTDEETDAILETIKKANTDENFKNGLKEQLSNVVSSEKTRSSIVGGQEETTPTEKVESEPTADIDNVADKAGIAPKNLRDLYNINRTLFGLNKVKSLAAAVAMDRMVGVMAKRAGITKAEMYGRLRFKKASETDLPQGVKMQVDAWHGSPYEFDKFSTENIGTGEGAQAFGWGLYFTDLKRIAEGYANMANTKLLQSNFSILNTKSFKNFTDGIADSELIEASLNLFDTYNSTDNITKPKLIAEYNEVIKDKEQKIKEKGSEWSLRPQLEKEISSYKKLLDLLNKKSESDILNALADFKKETEFSRNLYKVSLHEGKAPSNYTWLEWDKKPNKEQVNDLLSKLTQEQLDKGFYYGLAPDATNGTLYKNLVKALGGDKQASLFLLENGIDGVKYPAESISRGATSDTARGFNYVVFDENAVSVKDVIKFQKDANKARGAVMVTMDGNAVIYALTDPNVSTPLHELAHVFEHYLTDSERAAVNNWAKTGAWTTETSEKFARGFEKYLSEGIAPTEGLKKVFEKFKTWLTDIYNGIKGSDIDIELNDDMRSIYAKMLGEDAVPTKKTKAAPKKQDVEIASVFNSNPELAKIGTPEQYSQYLDSIFPNSKVTLSKKFADTYNIIFNGETIGTIDIPSDLEGDTISIGDVNIKPEFRGKGLGVETYKAAMKIAGKPLESFMATDEANRVWNSLIKQGLAKKTDTGFITISPLLGTKQDIDGFKKFVAKKSPKKAIQSDVIDKLVGNAANRREAYKEIADENIKEVAKIITDTNGKFDKVMDAIDNNDQLLADLEKKLGIKKICRI